MRAPVVSGEHFPKCLRIRKRREYQELQKGRRIASAHFVFFVRPRSEASASDAPPSRLGLIVSRRVGHAVLRNLVKRRSRELFRRHHRSWIGPGWDCAVLARPGAASLSWAQMQLEWRRALQKLSRPQSPRTG